MTAAEQAIAKAAHSMTGITISKDVAIIELITPSGFSAAGLYLEHDERLPKVYGRILKIGANVTDFKPGDVVVFERYATEPFVFRDRTKEHEPPVRYEVIHRDDVLAIVEGYDD